MNVRKVLHYMWTLAAVFLVMAGTLVLSGCALTTPVPIERFFPNEISSQDIKRALPAEDIDASAFIANPNKLRITCEYVNTPDFSKEGVYDVEINVFASNGARKTFTAKLTLYEADNEAPVIIGVADKRFACTDKISYLKGVSAVDDHDGEVEVSVDNSNIKMDDKNQAIPGQYKVIYTATDRAGNKTTAEATFYFAKENINDEMIDGAVAETLSQIVTDDMTAADKAWAIYLYSYRNIEYTGDSDKSDYRAEAYRGLTKKNGDCFTYFSVAKALLEGAGITDIVDVSRAPGGPMDSSHYWMLVNLGSGYYHFDSTRTKTWHDGFMQTDDQVKKFETDNKGYNGYYYRNQSLYPETPIKAFDYAKNWN